MIKVSCDVESESTSLKVESAHVTLISLHTFSLMRNLVNHGLSLVFGVSDLKYEWNSGSVSDEGIMVKAPVNKTEKGEYL